MLQQVFGRALNLLDDAELDLVTILKRALLEAVELLSKVHPGFFLRLEGFSNASTFSFVFRDPSSKRHQDPRLDRSFGRRKERKRLPARGSFLPTLASSLSSLDLRLTPPLPSRTLLPQFDYLPRFARSASSHTFQDESDLVNEGDYPTFLELSVGRTRKDLQRFILPDFAVDVDFIWTDIKVSEHGGMFIG